MGAILSSSCNTPRSALSPSPVVSSLWSVHPRWDSHRGDHNRADFAAALCGPSHADPYADRRSGGAVRATRGRRELWSRHSLCHEYAAGSPEGPHFTPLQGTVITPGICRRGTPCAMASPRPEPSHGRIFQAASASRLHTPGRVQLYPEKGSRIDPCWRACERAAHCRHAYR
jgi:hypothetical protein